MYRSGPSQNHIDGLNSTTVWSLLYVSDAVCSSRLMYGLWGPYVACNLQSTLCGSRLGPNGGQIRLKAKNKNADQSLFNILYTVVRSAGQL